MRTEYLKSIAKKIEKKQHSLFSFPVTKQRQYIYHFQEPKDNYERSYFQYCCQMKLYGEPIHTLINLSSLPMSILYLLKLRKITVRCEEKTDVVFFGDGVNSSIIPVSLRKEFLKLQEEKPPYGMCLSNEDIVFLRTVFRKYPVSWLLWLKVIIKISQYSYVASKYDPEVICTCGEFSFTSSILTEYCHTKGIEHVNIMHGEKLFYMRESFVHYDRYYVWDKYYIELLTSLRAETTQFRVEIPPALHVERDENAVIKFDFTYYLAGEDKSVLNNIAREMEQLALYGYRISVRPHPRYSNMREIEDIFASFAIEDVKSLSIEDSLRQTKTAIAGYSTVLNQAYHSGIDFLIDDISNPVFFNKLEELGYILLKAEHSLLSAVLDSKENS